MLNEGYALYKSLERCGMPLLVHHPDIKKPGKKKGLIVELGENGEVASIEFRDAKQMADLWTIRDSKKNSFPAMTLKMKLLKAEPVKKGDVRSIKSSLMKDGINPRFAIADWKSVVEKIKGQQNTIEQIPTQGNAYRELLRRMWRYADQGSETSIATQIVDKICQGLENGLMQFEQAAEFLYKDHPSGTFLFFDVADYPKFENRVAGFAIRPYISEYLFRIQRTSKEGICALGGKPTYLEDDKFPEPDLGKFGPAKIFSMNRNTPCHYRYGRISTEIVPIGRALAVSIGASLEWMTRPEREQLTWQMVPSGQIETRNGKKIFKDDLLLVYLESKPDLTVNNAHLLGGMNRQGFNESTFEAIAGKVIETLENAKDVKVNDQVKLFVLRKADKDKRQVALQRNYTVGQIIISARNWREAANNIPNFRIPIFIKENGENVWMSAWCPFPANLVRLTQTQWLRYGEGNIKSSGASLGEVYDVFFTEGKEKRNTAKQLLSLTLQRTQSLLIGLGQADHKREIIKFNPEKRFIALTTIAAFAIYLYKLEILKEEYMRSSLFNVGRFLSLVDTLHFEWCRHVRGGYPEEQDEKKWRKAIPPQLLGNAHFRIALDNPPTAFARLSERLNIYKAWVQKQQPANGNWAHWATAEIGKISLKIQDAIDEGKLPSATTDIDKTQILLGYLSRSEKKAETDFESAIEENLETK